MDLTGTWYDPKIDGSGLIIDDAPETRIVYWYGYATGFPGLTPGQMWLMGVQGDPADRAQLLLHRPSGEWMGAIYDLGEPVGVMELAPAEKNGLHVTFRFDGIGPCRPVMVSPVWDGCGGEMDMVRLTRTRRPGQR